MAAGATAEHEFASRQQWAVDSSLDQIEVSSVVSGGLSRRDDGSPAEAPAAVDQEVLDQVDAIVGPVDWFTAGKWSPPTACRRRCWWPTRACSITSG